MPNDINITVVERSGRYCASSGSRWEPIMGYSRAVRCGHWIAVTGTVGINADGTYDPTLGGQTRRSLAIIQAAIEALGGKLEQVVRTRIYMTDVSKWQDVAKVHGEIFADIRPATTLVEIEQLVDDEAQIEIEADAVVSLNSPPTRTRHRRSMRVEHSPPSQSPRNSIRRFVRALTFHRPSPASK